MLMAKGGVMGEGVRWSDNADEVITVAKADCALTDDLYADNAMIQSARAGK
jgi:hypothetical protein